MDDKFEAVKREDDDLPEFTLSEVLQMEKSFKKSKDKPVGQELYEELSVKFRFDVASFLSYKVLYSGELVVRVRFSGFGKDEDEWVSVKRAVRERSIPLENSECHKVDIGDLMLCYREAEHNALYCDARVVEIERKPHGGNQCTCIFVVRYEDDYSEGKLSLDKLCCRPAKSVASEIEDQKPVLIESLEVDQMLL
ncbi:Protein SAWADEE HOMEODOMAIN HOMOLOG 1 [Striga hermonthica]|uniref:Protein SAWADEE HOMEODOMAIN HOMOLOG 1 n=1 Tax=Striga hermonthica TaxID=68872 RepID=A0A9N7NBC4_STRHE|nr:Protein SAWADEE HOMEODOMAIN HOMOLOG 1 [Striga hermonthica]